MDLKTRPIESIILHCSASPDDRDIGVKEITEWHLQRGFKTIGYHFVIRRDGTVETGRDINKVGAHCEGHNMFSIGICWVGTNEISKPQRKSLLDLTSRLMKEYKLTIDKIYPHNAFNKHKTCPNLDMDAFKKDLKRHG